MDGMAPSSEVNENVDAIFGIRSDSEVPRTGLSLPCATGPSSPAPEPLPRCTNRSFSTDDSDPLASPPRPRSRGIPPISHTRAWTRHRSARKAALGDALPLVAVPPPPIEGTVYRHKKKKKEKKRKAAVDREMDMEGDAAAVVPPGSGSEGDGTPAGVPP